MLEWSRRGRGGSLVTSTGDWEHATPNTTCVSQVRIFSVQTRASKKVREDHGETRIITEPVTKSEHCRYFSWRARGPGLREQGEAVPRGVRGARDGRGHGEVLLLQLQLVQRLARYQGQVLLASPHHLTAASSYLCKYKQQALRTRSCVLRIFSYS